VLAGLWAPQGADAKVERPARAEIFVVPQRAYMVAGSLLDQCASPPASPTRVR
jgi:ATP-binding cassette subfamily D (ALD) long-chain fatty acid import protein